MSDLVLKECNHGGVDVTPGWAVTGETCVGLRRSTGSPVPILTVSGPYDQRGPGTDDWRTTLRPKRVGVYLVIVPSSKVFRRWNARTRVH